jgi:hypothetical protein
MVALPRPCGGVLQLCGSRAAGRSADSTGHSRGSTGCRTATQLNIMFHGGNQHKNLFDFALWTTGNRDSNSINRTLLRC